MTIYKEIKPGPKLDLEARWQGPIRLVQLVYNSALSWAIGVKMRREIRRELGRNATDTDLSSINTWIKVKEAEKDAKSHRG